MNIQIIPKDYFPLWNVNNEKFNPDNQEYMQVVLSAFQYTVYAKDTIIAIIDIINLFGKYYQLENRYVTIIDVAMTLSFFREKSELIKKSESVYEIKDMIMQLITDKRLNLDVLEKQDYESLNKFISHIGMLKVFTHNNVELELTDIQRRIRDEQQTYIPEGLAKVCENAKKERDRMQEHYNSLI